MLFLNSYLHYNYTFGLSHSTHHHNYKTTFNPLQKKWASLQQYFMLFTIFYVPYRLLYCCPCIFLPHVLTASFRFFRSVTTLPFSLTSTSTVQLRYKIFTIYSSSVTSLQEQHPTYPNPYHYHCPYSIHYLSSSYPHIVQHLQQWIEPFVQTVSRRQAKLHNERSASSRIKNTSLFRAWQPIHFAGECCKVSYSTRTERFGIMFSFISRVLSEYFFSFHKLYLNLQNDESTQLDVSSLQDKSSTEYQHHHGQTNWDRMSWKYIAKEQIALTRYLKKHLLTELTLQLQRSSSLTEPQFHIRLRLRKLYVLLWFHCDNERFLHWFSTRYPFVATGRMSKLVGIV